MVLLLYLFLLMLGATASIQNQFLHNYPTARSNQNKVLGMVLSYNLGHIDPFILILSEYQAMCEQGWRPTVVVFGTETWSDALRRYFRSKTFCYSSNSSIPLILKQYPANISTFLAAQHRKYMRSYIDDYDVFIYHEDDVIVTQEHLTAYLFETKRMYNLRPQLVNESIIGFQRYRRHLRPDGHRGSITDVDIFNQEFYEENPKFFPYCVDDVPYLAVSGNLHQAMWIMTKQQVLLLQDRCSFLNQTSPSREYMSSFSLYHDLPYACQLRKVIPGDRLVSFSVWHYYPALHPSTVLQLHTADENIRAGYFPWMPLLKSDYYEYLSCWNHTLTFSFAEQEADRLQASPSIIMNTH